MEILDSKEAQCSQTSIDVPPGEPFRGLVISSGPPPTTSHLVGRSSYVRFNDDD